MLLLRGAEASSLRLMIDSALSMREKWLGLVGVEAKS